MKKITALLACLTLCVSVLAGCGGEGKKDTTAADENTTAAESTAAAGSTAAESTAAASEAETKAEQETKSDAPKEMITDGYYTYSYPVEGIGDFTYFFHFYEDAPVIGSVFYAGFALNQICFAGTYQVEEKECAYACYEDRSAQEAEKLTEGTAPYTVTFYDWEGAVIDSCGFDGTVLYEDMEVITGVGGTPAFYSHDTEGEASKYISVYQAEVGMKYLDFVAEDPTSTLTLYHNGRYMDLVNMMVEGSWTMAEGKDGGYDYTLTPDSASDTAAVLSVAADTLGAVYTPDGGEATAMANTSEAGPKAAMAMTGKAPIPGQDGMEADLTLNLYDDGTCDLAASAFGQNMPLDAGTWSMGADGFTITLRLDTAGEIVSSLDAETKEVSVQYKQAGSMLGDLDTVLTVTFVAGAGE